MPSKVSTWEQRKHDPIWREEKRRKMREYWRLHKRPERLQGLPVKRGPNKTPEQLAETRARRASAAQARVAETAERKAKSAFWHDCQIIHCRLGCGRPFMRSELDPQRRCRDCMRQKRKEYRTKNREAYRLTHKAAKHRREARIKNAGGSWTAKQWLEILKRYGGKCAHCGSTDRITVDHIIPLAAGGSNDATNLQPLCHWHNTIKCDALTGVVQPMIPGLGLFDLKVFKSPA